MVKTIEPVVEESVSRRIKGGAGSANFCARRISPQGHYPPASCGIPVWFPEERPRVWHSGTAQAMIDTKNHTIIPAEGAMVEHVCREWTLEEDQRQNRLMDETRKMRYGAENEYVRHIKGLSASAREGFVDELEPEPVVRKRQPRLQSSAVGFAAIPFARVEQAIVANAGKRHRRTKAEMEAFRAGLSPTGRTATTELPPLRYDQVSPKLSDEKAKRHRRTKAEMQAARAMEAQGTRTGRTDNTVSNMRPPVKKVIVRVHKGFGIAYLGGKAANVTVRKARTVHACQGGCGKSIEHSQIYVDTLEKGRGATNTSKFCVPCAIKKGYEVRE